MEVVPLSVGRASRAWDEQHLDVAAAAEQIGGTSTTGFTDAVSGSAARFATTWRRHTAALADRAEARADGLRRAIRDYVATDDAAGMDLMLLLAYLGEER